MFGITIRAAGPAPRFWSLVDGVSPLEDAPSIRALNYAPHLTMARYEDLAPETLVEGLEVFKGVPPITLTFHRIGLFRVEPLVLWLEPRNEPGLVDLHGRLHAFLGEDLSDPHYRPGLWRPHCTIASSVAPEHRTKAEALAGEPIKPFAMTFDVADALEWPPVRQIGSRHLS
ncbi:2'-5' RNA ligase family protein [Lutibaculum baratangense]|uniref:Putative calmodulin-binding protein n=1 Tax=Lutibaculum baratangense AMV1 TaxID=631454 RepID=V4RG37_9HYPH|nr:2'-5' RNA ligase family protein [Lutibaculum baratangense]ESR25111.1 putative calmodulin-binding protein [Lutibaculum baratangense AMV1]